MNKIDKGITEYQVEVEEFEKWARGRGAKRRIFRGYGSIRYI